MSVAPRLLAALGLLWTVAALAAQVRQARGARARDHSRAAGDPRAGLRYNFSGAMAPGKKESARRHPLEFALGVLMHAGAVAALGAVVAAVAAPAAALAFLSAARPLFLVSLAAAISLLARRAISRPLRALSVPDDYVAVLATAALLLAALLSANAGREPTVLLGYAALLLAYFPLGKLRHAVFFFLARADYGRRLGHRGVYPPPRVAGESGE